MNGVRDVVLDSSGGVELMDVFAVSHDALAVSDVHVAGHLVDVHHSADSAALVRPHSGEVTRSVSQALRGVAQDVHNTPLLHLVMFDQLVAGVAALHSLGLGAKAGAAIVRRQGNKRERTLSSQPSLSIVSQNEDDKPLQ